MKRLALLVVAAAGVAVVWAALAGSGTAQQPGGERTLTFIERQGTFHFVDNPPRTGLRRGVRRLFISTGDMIVFTNPLYDSANKRRVGTVEASCVAVFGRRIFARARWVCDGTARLFNGQLALHASFRGQGRSVKGSVTGGTDTYEGAAGSFTSKERRGGTSTDVFHLVR